MNKEQKAAVIERVAAEFKDAHSVYAIDYRGISVPQAAQLRSSLRDAGASFRIVKNRLTARALDQAGAEELKELLEGPTALAFVRGDAALAAKAITAFQREHALLQIKGGTMDGDAVSADEIIAIARLPGREQLQGQLVGVLASPLTGLVRGLGSMVQGLAIQLEQIREQGLVGGEDTPPAATQDAAAEEATAEEPAAAEEATAEQPAPERETPAEGPAAEEQRAEVEAGEAMAEAPAETPEADDVAADRTSAEAAAETSKEPSEAPGDPVAEAEAAEAETSEEETPSDEQGEKEG